MERVTLTHQLALTMDQSSLDERAKAALADCLVLYEDTISQLNRSMDASSSHEDSQTWLSGAIANHETCKNGFMELDSSFHLPTSPFMTNNIFESLSNSLAINRAIVMPISSIGNRKLLSNGFPSWVSAIDRKLLQSSSVEANIVVAQDGSGNYKTISEAVAASVKQSSGGSRFVIHVKAGTYDEKVQITKSMTNLMLIGDGAGVTVITGTVTGGGFIAKDITFQNTAGPEKQQAVALRSGSDLSVFYRCSFEGYQDTLYVYSQRQFYRNCDIYGTVDFIFGDAITVLQSCNMYLRKPLTGQENTVTAQGRSDPNENTGISIQDSNIAAARGEPGLDQVVPGSAI
ncbi:uncharacterized protein A4U43_C09F16250 [Asparagus officinalis]|uniref:Pectinesterase n=1 Tax=Asparagus officinalis TaxID=4686 RepID=A0A5P1E850_ASPOF|nr:uncharacterized protein A4U43_C09F16250 [Asparagus officinalis]